VKFKCSRCGETVKITRSDFEQYKSAVPSLAAVGGKPVVASTAAAVAEPSSDSASIPAFDFEMPQEPAARKQQPPETSVFTAPVPPAGVKPAAAAGSAARAKEPLKEPLKQATPGIKTGPATATGIQPKQEVKTPVRPTPEAPLQPSGAAKPKQEVNLPPRPKTEQQSQPVPPHAPVAAPVRPAPVALSAAQTAPSSGWGKKLAIILIVLLLIGAAAFGGLYYFRDRLGIFNSVKQQITLPEGLEVKNITAIIDPATQDLVITGVVENTTDKPKAAWYIVAEVYDAQGNVLIKGKLLNGKQLYTRRDYEIMMRRGVNILELKQKILQEPGFVIGEKGTAGFELRIMEPPVGVASLNALLQPFNPLELSREMAEEQK
jgi:hypothetical protein